MSAAAQLHLELPSTFEALEQAVEQVGDFMEANTSDEDLAYRVVLLASEAITNGMEHGNRWDPQKKVIVDVSQHETSFELRVFDEGEGFDLSTVGNPLADQNLSLDRGRGLFFMQSMANEWHLEENGRLLRLVFYCSI